MKYKIVVSDFDGTLNNNGKVSQRFVQAVQAFRQKGGLFCISTGRSFESLKDWLPLYGMDKIDTPLMLCNGAVCQSSIDGRVTLEQSIDNTSAIEFAKILQNKNIYANIYVSGVKYIGKKTEFTKLYSDIDGGNPQFVEVGDLVEFLTKSKSTPQKFEIIDVPQKIVEFQKLLSIQFANLQVCIGHENILEVFSADAGKGNMVKILAQSLDVPLSQIVCIGDSQNDISMLEIAGLAVAVDNAYDYVKSICKHVTASVFDDGVAQVLEKVASGEW